MIIVHRSFDQPGCSFDITLYAYGKMINKLKIRNIQIYSIIDMHEIELFA